MTNQIFQDRINIQISLISINFVTFFTKKKMKASIDSVQLYMNKGNFDILLLIIDQIAKESELTEEVQNFKIECLYSLHRYLEAHELASKYAEEGNESQNLTFLRGLICFALELYEEAASHFKTNKQWSRWVTKSNLMHQISRKDVQPIMFSAEPKLYEKDSYSLSWSQTENEVILSVIIPNIVPSQIKVQSFQRSLDITITNGIKTIESIAVDLEKEILTRNTSFNVYPDRIDFILQKAVSGQLWNFEPKQNEPEITMDTILAELSTLSNPSHDEAAAGFQNMLKSTNADYTSSDDENDYSDQIPEPKSDDVNIA